MNTSAWAQAVKERDNWCCVECGADDDLIAHHILPVALGGRNDLDNGKTLCRPCHGVEHTGNLSTVEISNKTQGIPRYVAAYLMNISSTQVRNLQASGKLPTPLTGAACIEYLERKLKEQQAAVDEMWRRFEIVKREKAL